MSNPRVALIQMVSSRSVDQNLARLAPMIKTAAADATAIFLPENFAALAHSDPRVIGEAESSNQGPIRQFLAEMSRELGCWIFAGTIPVAVQAGGAAVSAPRVRAASLVYNDIGQEIDRYDKIHMFDVDVDDNHGSYRESDVFEPGTDIVLVDSPLGKVGLSVCYDIRFPELYRRMFLAGADIFAIPSAFTTTTGKAHFRMLMQARAVENSCFTIAACQGGDHESGRRTYGHSMICDPWGEVLGELETGEGILTVALDQTLQQRIRQEMPFRKQLRLIDQSIDG